MSSLDVKVTVNNQTYIYILDKDTLAIKDIVQTDTYNISQDIRLAGKSSFTIATPLKMVTGDYIIKKRKDIEYQGVISTVETIKKNNLYKIYTRELASIFDRQIVLSGVEQIETVGIETFVESTIKTYFTNSSDPFLNIKCITTIVKTNTPMDIEVSNQDNIYNFMEFLGFINETYGVHLEFKMENKKWVISIIKKEPTTMDVDATISDIVTYNESYQADTISKVVVLSKKTQAIFEYYLLVDGTITTDSTDVNRAKGTIETITCSRDKEARQKAEDTFRKNSYQHNITITLTKDSKLYSLDDFSIGRLLKIKTESSGIYNTFVAKIDTTSDSKIYTITCGNMKVTLLEKLKGVN